MSIPLHSVWTTLQTTTNATTSCPFVVGSHCKCTLVNTPKPLKLSFNNKRLCDDNNQRLFFVCISTGSSFVGWKCRSRQLHLRASSNGGGDVSVKNEENADTNNKEDEKWDYEKYRALLSGGEEVTSVMKEMIELLEDMTKMDAQSEEIVVQIAAQGVVGKRLEKFDSSFMMALDFMIGQCENELDGKRKWLLEVIKDTVLSYLTKKLPPHVQVVGMLCRTPRKESRQDLLRRVAGGGGTFASEDGGKVVLPKANLNDIANQADDLLETMEDRPTVPDRRLLARLVLIREEARSMMGGGILDERNDRGLSTLPDAEVALVSKLVALKPGPVVREKILNVMRGKDEGADITSEDESAASRSEKTSGHKSNQGMQTTGKGRPVRPGMFLETVTKVLGGMYEANVAGVTVQHLEWVHRETLDILQELAF